jgi:hypothetical protein
MYSLGLILFVIYKKTFNISPTESYTGYADGGSWYLGFQINIGNLNLEKTHLMTTNDQYGIDQACSFWGPFAHFPTMQCRQPYKDMISKFPFKRFQ